MSTHVVIIQPHFLPFIGYFDLMCHADVFVYYDTVQFVQRSWQCRTYITEGAIARWLSLPVAKSGGSRRKLQEIRLATTPPWREKMARRLLHVYASTRDHQLLEAMVELVRFGPLMLCDWNTRANQILADALNINTPTIRASELSGVSGDKQERLVGICQQLGATHYVCGPGSRFYVRDETFARHAIKVEWLDYDYEYRVALASGKSIFPSVLDMMLRIGRLSSVKALHYASRPSSSTLQS